MDEPKKKKKKRFSSTIELCFFPPDGFVSYWISLLDVISKLLDALVRK